MLYYGVPQGSVLGPVLSILYTQPYAQPLFGLVSKHTVNHLAFADDHALYKVSPHGAGFSRQGCLNQAAPPLSLSSYI